MRKLVAASGNQSEPSARRCCSTVSARSGDGKKIGEIRCASASNCHAASSDNAKPSAASLMGSKSRLIAASRWPLGRDRGA